MVFGGSRNVYITVTVLPKGHLRCHGGRAAIVRFPLGRGTGVPRLRYPVSSRWVAWEWYGKLVWKIYHKGVPCPWRSLESPLKMKVRVGTTELQHVVSLVVRGGHTQSFDVCTYWKYVCFFWGILDCWKGIIHHLFVSWGLSLVECVLIKHFGSRGGSVVFLEIFDVAGVRCPCDSCCVFTMVICI